MLRGSHSSRSTVESDLFFSIAFFGAPVFLNALAGWMQNPPATTSQLLRNPAKIVWGQPPRRKSTERSETGGGSSTPCNTLPFPPQQPNQYSQDNHRQHPIKVLPEEHPHQSHNLRSEPQSQQRKHKEAHKSPCEDGRQKVAEPHLKHCRPQHENLERHRRRQHPGKHQRPEFVLLERLVNLLKTLL